MVIDGHFLVIMVTSCCQRCFLLGRGVSPRGTGRGWRVGCLAVLAETADLHSRLLGSRFELRLGFEDVLFAKEAAKDRSGRRLGGWPERQGLVRGQGRLLRLHSASQGSVRPECAKDLAVEGLQVKFMLPFGPAVRCPKLATRYQEGNQEEPGAAFAAWWMEALGRCGA